MTKNNNNFVISNIKLICTYLNLNENDILQKLNEYNNLLINWQQKINLISNNDINNIYHRHIYNSLQLLPYIASLSYNNTLGVSTIKDLEIYKNNYPLNIADFGSGAGFPAIVLAIFNPNNKYYLFENNTKKCAFLNTVVGTLNLKNVKVINDKAQNIHHYVNPNIITARGLSQLNNLIQISLPSLQNKAICLFLKGAESTTEIEETQNTPSNLSITILENKLPQNEDNNWQIVSVATNKP